MPTKYTREDSPRALRERRRTPFLSHAPGRGLNRRRRFVLLYAAVLAFFLLLAAGQFVGARFAYLGQPVRRGVGEVVAKEVREGPDGAPAYWLRVRVSLGEGVSAEAGAPMDREHWAAFAPGDRVAVLYQRANGRAAVRLHECGLVALPPGE